MKKRIILGIIIVALIIVAGTTFGVVKHQNDVKAQTAQVNKEKEALKTASAAIDTAYQTRADKDLKSAETALSKLGTQEKAEKTKLTEKLSQLKGFLKQIADVNAALSKATQSKAEQDIKATQALIDKETDTYLKTDKTEAQNKLNALIAQLAKEKSEKEAKAKAESDAKAAADAAEAQRQAEAAAQAAAAQPSDQPAYNEAPQQYYDAPAQGGGGYEAPAQGGGGYTPSAPSAPAQGGGYTPPAQGGGSGYNGQPGWEVTIPGGNPAGAGRDLPMQWN